MNWLIEDLPESVVVNGREYPVNSGFRAMLLIDMLMHDRELNDQEKMVQALDVFYRENIPEDAGEAAKQMIWFQRCGEMPKKKTAAKKLRKKANRALDYEKDSKYIFADFFSIYGIRLTDSAVKLHWWEFSAMLECLPEKCRICKIMYYRTADTRGMGKEQKKFIQKMKELYKLEDEVCTEDCMTLAERNRAMIAYVNQRYKDAGR